MWLRVKVLGYRVSIVLYLLDIRSHLQFIKCWMQWNCKPSVFDVDSGKKVYDESDTLYNMMMI